MSQTSPVSSPTCAADTPAMVFYEARGWRFADLMELWRNRGLIWIFGLRDLKIRYRQTFIGVAWAVIQPVTMMLVFTGMFRLMGKNPATGTVPYALTLYCGLLPWQLFSTTLSQCSNSLVANRNLLTKVYFPRLAMPLATALVGLADFACALLVLFGLMLWWGITPGWPVVALPLFVGLALLTSLAFGLWLAALNAIYRDVGFAVPFLLQTAFFVSPVIYETDALIPKALRPFFSLNPMAGVLDGFRWSLLGGEAPPWQSIGISFGVLMIALVGGLHYFRRIERNIADRI